MAQKPVDVGSLLYARPKSGGLDADEWAFMSSW